jgi:UDP-GlcNAc:undecaprenyl-phosphate GlcNAc-1-phosphate transferase
MDSAIWIVFLAALFAFEVVYFKIASYYGIVDRPNHRTMHQGETIRGGGIVFYISILLYAFWQGGLSVYFMAGTSVLAFISFIDDLHHLPSFLRSLVQVGAVTALVGSTGFFDWSVPGAVLMVIVFTGALNAYNFMDGINGITGGYSMVFMLTAYTINQFWISFVDPYFLWSIIAGLIVFNFFNFRKKARCFSGDIGSITMAYVVVYLLLLLIKKSGNPVWILLLSLYGIDTVATIIQRIFRRENIFEAHRLHLFQAGIYKGGWTQLQMATAFMIVQSVVNLLLICMVFYIPSPSIQWILALTMLLVLSVIYAYIKFRVLKIRWL